MAPGTTGTVLQHLTINGSQAETSFTACSQDYVGVYLPNSSGTLNNVKVQDIQQPAGSFAANRGPTGMSTR